MSCNLACFFGKKYWLVFCTHCLNNYAMFYLTKKLIEKLERDMVLLLLLFDFKVTTKKITKCIINNMKNNKIKSFLFQQSIIRDNIT